LSLPFLFSKNTCIYHSARASCMPEISSIPWCAYPSKVWWRVEITTAPHHALTLPLFLPSCVQLVPSAPYSQRSSIYTFPVILTLTIILQSSFIDLLYQIVYSDGHVITWFSSCKQGCGVRTQKLRLRLLDF
jgi:hypothetical protein